jgi:hypothetical protein
MENETGWYSDLEPALDITRTEGKHVLLQFIREDCSGCRKMDANTFSDPDVDRELFQWFIPVRMDILKHRAIRSQYSAYWTPSFYFLDYKGIMHHSFNGFQNPKDFRILMRLGKAELDMPRGRYLQVIDLMDDGLSKFPENPRSAAMLFMRGMAEYLLGKERSTFRGTMSEIYAQYPESLEARMWPWPDKP